MASRAALQVHNPQTGTLPVSERSTSDVRGGAQAAQVDGQGGRQSQAGLFTSDQQGESKHVRTLPSSSSEINPLVNAEQKQQQSGPESLEIVKLKKEIDVLSRKVALAVALQEENKALGSRSAVVNWKTEEEKKQVLIEKFAGFKPEERLAVNILTLKEDIKKAEALGFPSAICSEKLKDEGPEGPSAEEFARIEEAEVEALGELFKNQLKNRGRETRKIHRGKSGSVVDIENQLALELPEAYLEIKRLLWVDGQKVFKKALEVWRGKEALFTKRVERKKGKVAELKNEVYQLIGFLSVFQGVVLTAVAQSSLLHCTNLWSPISLSVLASVITIAGVIQKLTHISDFQKTVHSEEQSLKEVIGRVSALRKQGEAFTFTKFCDRLQRPTQQKSEQVFYSAFVIIALLAFTVLFPVSHWRILCH